MDKSFKSLTLSYLGRKKLVRTLHPQSEKGYITLVMNQLRVSFGAIPNCCEKAREKWEGSLKPT